MKTSIRTQFDLLMDIRTRLHESKSSVVLYWRVTAASPIAPMKIAIGYGDTFFEHSGASIAELEQILSSLDVQKTLVDFVRADAANKRPWG